MSDLSVVFVQLCIPEVPFIFLNDTFTQRFLSIKQWVFMLFCPVE